MNRRDLFGVLAGGLAWLLGGRREKPPTPLPGAPKCGCPLLATVVPWPRDMPKSFRGPGEYNCLIGDDRWVTGHEANGLTDVPVGANVFLGLVGDKYVFASPLGV